MLEELLNYRFQQLGYQDPRLSKTALAVIKPYWLERVGSLITENQKLKHTFLKPSTKEVIQQVIKEYRHQPIELQLEILETKKLNAYYFGNS